MDWKTTAAPSQIFVEASQRLPPASVPLEATVISGYAAIVPLLPSVSRSVNQLVVSGRAARDESMLERSNISRLVFVICATKDAIYEASISYTATICNLYTTM